MNALFKILSFTFLILISLEFNSVCDTAQKDYKLGQIISKCSEMDWSKYNKYKRKEDVWSGNDQFFKIKSGSHILTNTNPNTIFLNEVSKEIRHSGADIYSAISLVQNIETKPLGTLVTIEKESTNIENMFFIAFIVPIFGGGGSVFYYPLV